MRLSREHIDMIVKFAKEDFGDDIKLYLFGSRADDSQKGGDIDLLLESDEKIPVENQMNFLANISRHVTERKVDLAVFTPDKAGKTFYENAKKQGIRLC
ncbi:MAG: nucleotidyltransferase domain-containing protein [Candidatus Kapaibacterium sp.]